MPPTGEFQKDLTVMANHEKLIADFEAMIPKAAAAGVPNLICFSGNREGQNDNEGMINCAKGFRKLMPTAEKHGVTILWNFSTAMDIKTISVIKQHGDAALCEMVGSERFKLLYDIYHMQMMEGNVIENI